MTMDAADEGTASTEVLRERLERARARAEAASRGGPEWDAAMAEVEELEAALNAAA